MTRASGGLVIVFTAVTAGIFGIRPNAPARAADPPPTPALADPALDGSTIAALLDASDGKVPATGKELWAALSKLGTFAQLPVVFSAVRLDSGIGNPRVVIAPVTDAPLSDADPTAPNLNGRLFLAANMDRGAAGTDPRVTSVEFISWNTALRRFDFGVIEGMGDDDGSKLRVVDGGRCFSCHKNRGPILGVGPWTNTTHHTKLRVLVADRLKLVDAVPAGAAGVGKRDRIDGMALVSPQAQAVDSAVRAGASLRPGRDMFRMMNGYAGGRKAFVVLLGAVVQPGPLDPADARWRPSVNAWANEQSYLRFGADWTTAAKPMNVGTLSDFAPFPKLMYEWNDGKPTPIPPPPKIGFRTPADAQKYEKRVREITENNQRLEAAVREKMIQLALYDQTRASGRHGMPSVAQPSNPRAFVPPPAKVPNYPAEMFTPVLLARVIGLTEGDRKFLSQAVADAAARLTKQKVTAAALAKAVFEGPEFADVLAGGPLPDRDDFKDRFVAGLNAAMTTKYGLADGFTPDRATYARGPRRDPKAAERAEAAVVPTSACLRCHDVRDGTPARLVEPIPPLAFDPFDEPGRTAWLKTAAPKRKLEVLTRLRERLYADADMPPQDAPEYDPFRVKRAAAFENLKRVLDTELDALAKP